MEISSTLTTSASKFFSLTNKWATLLTFLIWPFGHLLKIFSFYLLDIACFFVFITFLFGGNLIKFKKNILFRSLNVFWFSLLVSILYSLWQQKAQAPAINFLYYLRTLVYPFLAFSIFIQNSDDLKKVIRFSGLAFFVLGIAQYLLLPDLRLYKNIGFDDHYYRLAGTLLDPNFTGAVLATAIVYLLLAKEYLTSIFALVGLALTFSRASYLSFILTALTIFLQKKYKKLLLLFPLLALLILFSPKPFGEGVNLFRTYSISSRLASFGNGLQLLGQNPLFGVGFGQLTGPYGQKISVDNSYIYLLAGSGILGFVSFLFVIFAILKTSHKNTYLLLLPILIHSLFNNSFFYIWIMSLFWVIVGFSLKENKSI